MSTSTRNTVLLAVGVFAVVALLAIGVIVYSNSTAPKTPADGSWILHSATDWDDCPDQSESMVDGAYETSCSNGLRAAVFWEEEDLTSYVYQLGEEEVEGVLVGGNWVMVSDDPETHLANLEAEEYEAQLATGPGVPEGWTWREPDLEVRDEEPMDSELPW